MQHDLGLDLLQYSGELKVKTIDGKRYIFDEIRRKWLVLQPEEMVRQLVIHYLLAEKGYNKNRISLEKGLKVNTLSRRFDVLAYDMQMRPFLLIECKAPQVDIGAAAFQQIANYNTTLKVPYLLVSNGRENFCCFIDYEKENFLFLEAIPDFQD
jgi:predicted type IV restriction endonuclease